MKKNQCFILNYIPMGGKSERVSQPQQQSSSSSSSYKPRPYENRSPRSHPGILRNLEEEEVKAQHYAGENDEGLLHEFVDVFFIGMTYLSVVAKVRLPCYRCPHLSSFHAFGFDAFASRSGNVIKMIETCRHCFTRRCACFVQGNPSDKDLQRYGRYKTEKKMRRLQRFATGIKKYPRPPRIYRWKGNRFSKRRLNQSNAAAAAATGTIKPKVLYSKYRKFKYPSPDVSTSVSSSSDTDCDSKDPRSVMRSKRQERKKFPSDTHHYHDRRRCRKDNCGKTDHNQAVLRRIRVWFVRVPSSSPFLGPPEFLSSLNYVTTCAFGPTEVTIYYPPLKLFVVWNVVRSWRIRRNRHLKLKDKESSYASSCSDEDAEEFNGMRDVISTDEFSADDGLTEAEVAPLHSDVFINMHYKRALNRFGLLLATDDDDEDAEVERVYFYDDRVHGAGPTNSVAYIGRNAHPETIRAKKKHWSFNLALCKALTTDHRKLINGTRKLMSKRSNLGSVIPEVPSHFQNLRWLELPPSYGKYCSHIARTITGANVSVPSLKDMALEEILRHYHYNEAKLKEEHKLWPLDGRSTHFFTTRPYQHKVCVAYCYNTDSDFDKTDDDDDPGSLSWREIQKIEGHNLYASSILGDVTSDSD